VTSDTSFGQALENNTQRVLSKKIYDWNQIFILTDTFIGRPENCPIETLKKIYIFAPINVFCTILKAT
jgi:hypothetical protein